MWDVDSKQIIFDFNEHKDIVNCCAVSPDDKWVISCDKSSAILVKVCTFVNGRNLSYSAHTGMGGQNR